MVYATIGAEGDRGRRASARVCGRAYSRGISVAARPAKESFRCPLFQSLPQGPFSPRRLFVPSPLHGEDHLPQFQSCHRGGVFLFFSFFFFCPSTIITRDFSRFQPPPDRYPTAQWFCPATLLFSFPSPFFFFLRRSLVLQYDIVARCKNKWKASRLVSDTSRHYTRFLYPVFISKKEKAARSWKDRADENGVQDGRC